MFKINKASAKKLVTGFICGTMFVQLFGTGIVFADTVPEVFVPEIQEVKANPGEFKDALSYSYDNSPELMAGEIDIPAKYDPRKKIGIDWPVQDQGEEGNCWAFSATAAREAWVDMKFKSNFDLFKMFIMYSPLHMAASIYKNEDSDWTFNTTATEGGGNREYAAAYYSRGSGPVLLRNFGTNKYNSYLKSMDYSMLTDVTSTSQVTSALFLTGTDGAYKMNGVKNEYDQLVGYKPQPGSYNTNNQMIIKEAILKYGAVMSSYHSPVEGTDENDTYYNEKESAYCWCPDPDVASYTNHGITIVGWDDNYSAKNFKKLPDGAGKGAWIIRNSWGSKFGDDGYMYISYYDYFIGSNAAAFPGSMAKSDYVNQFDGLWPNASIPEFTSGYYAVVRHKTQTPSLMEKINAIGLVVQESNTKITFLLEDDASGVKPKVPQNVSVKPEFKKHDTDAVTVEDNTATFEYPGYYVLELKEPEFVTGNYDLYFKYENPQGYSAIPLVMNGSDMYTSNSVTVPGISWYGLDYALTDAQTAFHFPIKTYTDAVKEIVSTEVEVIHEENTDEYELVVDVGIPEEVSFEGEKAMVAVYDENGVLIGFHQQKLHFEEGHHHNEVHVNYDSTGDSYRVMIWDGANYPHWAMENAEHLPVDEEE